MCFAGGLEGMMGGLGIGGAEAAPAPPPLSPEVALAPRLATRRVDSGHRILPVRLSLTRSK